VRIEKLEREYDIRVEYVNFPLHPDTPPEGISLADLFGPDALPRIAESQKRLKHLAAAEGLPLADRSMTYNSRLAQELGRWATDQGRGPEFHRAAFTAYFAEGKNISNVEVLTAIAEQAGLDSREARKVVQERRYEAAVDREWSACEAAGIEAVPTFDVGGQRMAGLQPYEQLAAMVQAAGAKKRSSGADRP
jgi:predicted DsbA family dithiol-disulfide isomerase